MTDIPQDIMAKARTMADEVSFGGYEANALSIAKALLAERQRDQWQDISTAPKDGTWVFLFWPMMKIQEYPTIGFNCSGYWETPGSEEIYPTHWMPLPATPKGTPT